MDGGRESDRFRVPRKPSNKGRPQGLAEQVEGREQAKGNVAGETRSRTTAPGSPVTWAQPRTAGTFGGLHVDPRQEPGAGVPHAGIGAGLRQANMEGSSGMKTPPY